MSANVIEVQAQNFPQNFPQKFQNLTGVLRFKALTAPVMLGRNGVAPAEHKREGDGKTPLGLYPVRYFFYRGDRMAKPKTRLAARALEPSFGWCDDPKDKSYNQFVKLPYRASCETLWRADGLYDLILVLGFNDQPALPQKGSAIFMHCAAKQKTPTEGCVALELDALRQLLALCDEETKIAITCAHQK